jgi:hypothetical protein
MGHGTAPPKECPQAATASPNMSLTARNYLVKRAMILGVLGASAAVGTE